MSIKPEKLKKLPDSPGVYIFKKGKDILYIGKATSLRDRVRSYFSNDLIDTRGIRIEKMIEEADALEWQETDSALEALILEANLIKKHQPKYNVREKDQKSFNFVVITNEEFPRVLKVRGRELVMLWDEKDIKHQFGPFPHGSQLNEALRIIRKIFPYRGEKDPVGPKGTTSPLNRQLGLTPRLGEGGMSRKDYMKRVKHIKLLFEGKKEAILKELDREMKKYAQSHKFEKAADVRNRIFALQHIRDVSLIKNKRNTEGGNGLRIEAYDIAHTAGQDSVGVMVVVEGGLLEKNSYRKFAIKTASAGSDTGALKEVLERRLTHSEWPLPAVFVIDGGKAQLNAAQSVLKQAGVEIPVVSVLKDERHRPKNILGPKSLIRDHESDILLSNAEAHRFAVFYHRQKRGRFLK